MNGVGCVPPASALETDTQRKAFLAAVDDGRDARLWSTPCRRCTFGGIYSRVVDAWPYYDIAELQNAESDVEAPTYEGQTQTSPFVTFLVEGRRKHASGGQFTNQVARPNAVESHHVVTEAEADR